MMSASQVHDLAEAACRRSRAEGILPIAFTAEELADDAKLRAHVRRIPFIGTRRPRGFKLVAANTLPIPRVDSVCVPYWGEEARRYVQVDSSGLGSANEPALMPEEFYAAVRAIGPGKCYALVETGQFQVVIGVFERVEVKRESRRQA